MIGKNNECFLCGRNGAADTLDAHHIFGGSYRKKSDQYGLVVMLCHNECHIYGPMAAHRNADTMLYLHQQGQRIAMREYNWTVSEFIKQFGKNYL